MTIDASSPSRSRSESMTGALSGLRLPALAHVANKYRIGAAAAALAAVLYLSSNHFHVFEPQFPGGLGFRLLAIE